MKFKVVAAIGSRRLPAALCPYCGEKLDAVTSAAMGTMVAAEFKAGDFSMCGGCAQILFYDGRFYHQVLPEEADRVLAESSLLRSMRKDILARQAERFASKTGKPTVC